MKDIVRYVSSTTSLLYLSLLYASDISINAQNVFYLLRSEQLHEEVENITKRSSGLRELTYSYANLQAPDADNPYGLKFNETIFFIYGGANNPEETITFIKSLIKHPKELQNYLNNLKVQIEEKLKSDIQVLKDYPKECEQSEISKTELLIAALELTYNALDFELELAGYESGLSEEESQQKTDEIHRLDAVIFGEHVSEDAEFVLESCAYIKYYLTKHAHELSDEDKNAIIIGIDTMLAQVNSFGNCDQQYTFYTIPNYTPDERNPEFEKLKDVSISREDYIAIFDMFFEVADVPQRSKIGNFAAFYDGDHFYGVPSGYGAKTLYDILKLAPHETSHYINLKESQEDGKEPGDMIKEEGLSMLTEGLISGKDLHTMRYMTFSGPTVVLNRLLDGPSYLKFFKAYSKLLKVAGLHGAHDSEETIVNKALRKKRAASKSRPGGSNKDASYAQGLKEVLTYIRDGGELPNLFGGKISMETVKSGERAPENFGNKYIHHILLTELVFFYHKNDYYDREKRRASQGDFHDQFVTYLKEKYGYLAQHFRLFKPEEKFSMSIRTKAMRILKIVEKSKKTSQEAQK